MIKNFALAACVCAAIAAPATHAQPSEVVRKAGIKAK